MRVYLTGPQCDECDYAMCYEIRRAALREGVRPVWHYLFTEEGNGCVPEGEIPVSRTQLFWCERANLMGGDELAREELRDLTGHNNSKAARETVLHWLAKGREEWSRGMWRKHMTDEQSKKQIAELTEKGFYVELGESGNTFTQYAEGHHEWLARLRKHGVRIMESHSMTIPVTQEFWSLVLEWERIVSDHDGQAAGIMADWLETGENLESIVALQVGRYRAFVRRRLKAVVEKMRKYFYDPGRNKSQEET